MPDTVVLNVTYTFTTSFKATNQPVNLQQPFPNIRHSSFYIRMWTCSVSVTGGSSSCSVLSFTFTLFHILGFLSNIKIKSISFNRSFRSLTYYSQSHQNVVSYWILTSWRHKLKKTEQIKSKKQCMVLISAGSLTDGFKFMTYSWSTCLRDIIATI